MDVASSLFLSHSPSVKLFRAVLPLALHSSYTGNAIEEKEGVSIQTIRK